MLAAPAAGGADAPRPSPRRRRAASRRRSGCARPGSAASPTASCPYVFPTLDDGVVRRDACAERPGRRAAAAGVLRRVATTFEPLGAPGHERLLLAALDAPNVRRSSPTARRAPVLPSPARLQADRRSGREARATGSTAQRESRDRLPARELGRDHARAARARQPEVLPTRRVSLGPAADGVAARPPRPAPAARSAPGRPSTRSRRTSPRSPRRCCAGRSCGAIFGRQVESYSSRRRRRDGAAIEV